MMENDQKYYLKIKHSSTQKHPILIELLDEYFEADGTILLDNLYNLLREEFPGFNIKNGRLKYINEKINDYLMLTRKVIIDKKMFESDFCLNLLIESTHSSDNSEDNWNNRGYRRKKKSSKSKSKYAKLENIEKQAEELRLFVGFLIEKSGLSLEELNLVEPSDVQSGFNEEEDPDIDISGELDDSGHDFELKSLFDLKEPKMKKTTSEVFAPSKMSPLLLAKTTSMFGPASKAYSPAVQKANSIDIAILYSNPLVEKIKKLHRSQTVLLQHDIYSYSEEISHYIDIFENSKKSIAFHGEGVSFDQFVKILKDAPKILHLSCQSGYDIDNQFYLGFECSKLELIKVKLELLNSNVEVNLEGVDGVILDTSYSEVIGF